MPNLNHIDGGVRAGITAPPEMARIPRICAMFDLSRSGIYRLAGEGKIRLIKAGSTTLVDVGSVRAYLASLPTAPIRAPKAA